MVKKALPILAVVMTVAAAWVAYMYNRDENMLKTLKKNNAPTAGLTDAQLKHWNAL